MKKLSVVAVALLGTTALASAADLPARTAPAYAPAYAAPLFTWTGFYVGVNAGYGGDKYEYPFSSPLGGGVVGKAQLNSSGFVGGGQAGYNYQFMGNWVAGLEADIQYANVDGKLQLNAPTFGSASIGSELQYLGTVRGRLGYAILDKALIYATGGFAYGQVKSSIEAGGLGLGSFTASRSKTSTGWTVGAGIEYALTPN